MRAVGTRSLISVALLAGATLVMWQGGLLREDYWAQLSPWVPFLAGGFAVLGSTLVSGFWRVGEPSEYYLRFGERLPFGGETALGPSRGRTLLIGHAAHVRVLDFPPVVQRCLQVAVFLGVGLITVDNRAVATLRQAPGRLEGPRFEYCAAPAPPKLAVTRSQGCRLIERAYKLGYAKSLGSCAPQAAEQQQQGQVGVCRRRQLDEPYLHYAWRLLDGAGARLAAAGSEADIFDRLDRQLGHLGAMAHATLDSSAMQPRSSHHLFTNLPDPRASLGARLTATIERGCGARLAHLAHFPRIEDPSLLLEHVLDQLLFNPIYRPIVAQCEELVVHWNAPADTCARLAENPVNVLEAAGAWGAVAGVLGWRHRKAELGAIQAGIKQGRELAPVDRIVSFQCLMFGQGNDTGETTTPVERPLTLDGAELRAREARMRPLVGDGESQIRLYKQLAALLVEGFGYGRLTSNQAVGARPEEATMAASFGNARSLLTKLDLLRDADLFLGNEWLARRPDLLDTYPFHLHLQNFVEIFRRQYKQHRGRL
jgi:hypothetical protein